MEGLIAALALMASCLGWGLSALRLLRARPLLTAQEHAAWAAIIGMGLSGWLTFPASLALGANRPSILLITAGGILLLALLRRDLAPGAGRPAARPVGEFSLLTWGLLGAAALVAIFDLAAGLVPPVDADSMAYHFAQPKRFLEAGRIQFIPQAVEAAIPLLFHMTYMQALALGGELGLTLWCGLSSWLLPLAAFATARRHLNLNWAIALMVAVKSMPAVVYGSPAGQIEVRLAAMFLVAAVTASRARPSDDWRPAALAGLAAGFCAGAKYSGLLAPAVCGLVLIGGWSKLPRMAAFGLAALLGGGQWYLWNGLNTGDPLFPLLWGLVPYSAAAHWDESMSQALRSTLAGEMGVPKSLFWLLAYPLKATFDGLPIFESARTGFGVLPVLLVPFALAGWFLRRRTWKPGGELGVLVIICLAGYVLWFVGGASQRVRHFLPELVPLLLVLMVAAARAGESVKAIARPLGCGIALTLLLQLGGQAVYSAYTLRHLVHGGGRDEYLAHNIAAYPVVQWLNTHLGRDDRIMLVERELVFHITVPSHYSPPTEDGRIRLSDPVPVLPEFLRQLRAQGITHVLVYSITPSQPPFMQWERTGWDGRVAELVDAGCASVQAELDSPVPFASRTLRTPGATATIKHYVIALSRLPCALDPTG